MRSPAFQTATSASEQDVLRWIAVDKKEIGTATRFDAAPIYKTKPLGNTSGGRVQRLDRGQTGFD